MRIRKPEEKSQSKKKKTLNKTIETNQNRLETMVYKNLNSTQLNNPNSSNLKIIGWNCRSLIKTKILYIKYLLTERKPDYIIICESWLNEKPTRLNQNYEIYQTKYSKYQGVCIIAKKNKVKKIYTNEEQYIISVEAKTNEKTYFIIRVYFKQKIKSRILEQLKKLITRIKKT